MTKLNELEKEYLSLASKDTNEEGNHEEEGFLRKKIETHGNIQEKRIDSRGFPQFRFKDGFWSTIAPRGYKFRGPMVPEGIDIKQFEVK